MKKLVLALVLALAVLGGTGIVSLCTASSAFAEPGAIVLVLSLALRHEMLSRRPLPRPEGCLSPATANLAGFASAVHRLSFRPTPVSR
jgi:hypothetical protein